MEFSPSGHFNIQGTALNTPTLQRAEKAFDLPHDLKTTGGIALRDQEKAMGFTQEILIEPKIPVTWIIAADGENPFLQVPGRATMKVSYVKDDVGRLKRELTFGIVPIRGQSRFTAQRVIITESMSGSKREGLDKSISDESFVTTVIDLIEQADFSDPNKTLVNVYSL